MDNEEKTNEPQKPDGFTPGIERMTEKLETVFSTAMQALQVAPKLESGGHKWMVLSKAIGEIRHVLGPCAIMPDACFHKLHEFVSTPPASGTGAFHTPKQAIDFIMGNPPFGEVKDVPTPIDPNAPKMVQGEKPFTRLSLVNIPGLNIEFHQFYTDDYFKAVCYWENKEGERRVYEITVKPWAATGTAKWRARAQVSGKVLFYLEAASKCLAIECALVAMRRYLIRAHRAAWRTYRKAHAKGGE